MIQKQNWVQIPYDIRVKLVDIFMIPRSETVIVEGMVVKSDGRTQEDLDKSITIEKMRDYLGMQSSDASVTSDDLFKEVLKKVQGNDVRIIEVQVPEYILAKANIPEPTKEPTPEVKPQEEPVKPQENQLKCTVCGKEAKNKAGLSAHSRSHKK